jgi:hypothetical protein
MLCTENIVWFKHAEKYGMEFKRHLLNYLYTKLNYYRKSRISGQHSVVNKVVNCQRKAVNGAIDGQ